MDVPAGRDVDQPACRLAMCERTLVIAQNAAAGPDQVLRGFPRAETVLAHECRQMAHLDGAGQFQGRLPVIARVVHRLGARRIGHLPDVVAAVHVPAGTGEHGVVGGAARLHVAEVMPGDRLPARRHHRVRLVVGLPVEHRPGGPPFVVLLDHLVVRGSPAGMAGLHHVEVEPVGVGQEVRGRPAAGRVERDQLSLSGDPPDAGGERLDHCPLPGVFDGAVAAQHPDDVVAAITLGDPRGVPARVGGMEEGRRAVVPVAAPGGQDADGQPERIGPADDPVDMPPVVFVGPRGVEVVERQVPFRVRHVQAVEL